MLKKICFLIIFTLSFVQYTMSKENFTWSSSIDDKEMYFYGDSIFITLYADDVIIMDVPHIKIEFYWLKGSENTPENEILVEINTLAMLSFDIKQIGIRLMLQNWDKELLKDIFGKQNSFKEYFCIRIYGNDELLFKKNDILIIGKNKTK